MEKIKIVVWDSCEIFIEGLSTILNKSPICSLIDIIRKDHESFIINNWNKFDVLLINLAILSDSSIDKLILLKNKFNLRIIYYFSSESDYELYKSYNSGVHGFFSLEYRRIEIIKIILSVFHGRSHFGIKNYNDDQLTKIAL